MPPSSSETPHPMTPQTREGGEPTPTPWTVLKHAQGSELPTAGVLYIVPANRHPRTDYNDICTVEAQGGLGEQDANAALIVQAVNERCALLERLEGAKRVMELLASALDRTSNNLSRAIRQTPVRDLAENLGENAHAKKEYDALLASPPARPATQPDKKD